MSDFYKYVVVGAGISGSVIAERIASVLKQRVLLIDRRNKIGGNSSASIDPETGIEVHDYGSHIFHTSNEKVWRYLNSFTAFNQYQHKVIFRNGGKSYFLPINLKTLQEFFDVDFTPDEAAQMLDRIKCEAYGEPTNLETKAISLIGSHLYEFFIKGYTSKQWNCNPNLLPANIINRLPVRTDYNVNYFNDIYQGIPAKGYGYMFKNIIDTPLVDLRLNCSFNDIRSEIPDNSTVIYTGMVDELFDYSYGELEWRSLRFESEKLEVKDFQGNAVVNYGDENIPYTRIHEFKHYHPEWQESLSCKKTIICREFPSSWKRGDEAYYPVSTSRNEALHQKYIEKAGYFFPNMIFCGRLANYKYWDMDKAVAAALDCFETLKNKCL